MRNRLQKRRRIKKELYLILFTVHLTFNIIIRKTESLAIGMQSQVQEGTLESFQRSSAEELGSYLDLVARMST